MLIALGLTVFGIGFWNNTVALVVLAIPPILTNAYFAMEGVDPDAVDAARGVGMTELQVLLRVELPLGLPLVFAGIRIAAIFVIATATIAAIAGGGGLGEIIVNRASYGDAGVVAASLCVSALAFAAALILSVVRCGVSPRHGLRRLVSADTNVPGGGSRMIRKHMRRAAKAAFAISLGVALVLGGTATAGVQKHAAAPTILVGNKNFTEEFILGQLYGQALQAKGFKVKYAGSLGSSELADTAIKSGKINFYPEYTGVIVLDLAKKTSPKSAAATYAAAKKFEETRGLTLLNATPFYDTDSFGMLTSTAHKYGVKTIGDMKKVKSFSFAGYPECQTRITCLLGLKNLYGLKQVKFVPLVQHQRLHAPGPGEDHGR